LSIDATHGIIQISGAIDPIKLLTEIKKAEKHAELIATDIGDNSDHVLGQSHPNSNHRNEYMNNEYNGNHGPAYHHHNDYNGNFGSKYGYGYNEYDGKHGNVVPYYNHNQYHSDPYQYNDVLAPQAPSASEQMQHNNSNITMMIPITTVLLCDQFVGIHFTLL